MKVIVVERYARRYNSTWQLVDCYHEDNKQVAKDFVQKKNTNNNCSYTYRVRTKKLK